MVAQMVMKSSMIVTKSQEEGVCFRTGIGRSLPVVASKGRIVPKISMVTVVVSVTKEEGIGIWTGICRPPPIVEPMGWVVSKISVAVMVSMPKEKRISSGLRSCI